MKHIIISTLCALLISCSNSQAEKSASNATVTSKNETVKFQLDPNFEYAHLIPDSLRTPQQKEMVKTLYTAIEKYTTIDTVNNKLVFNATEKDFADMGLARQYYSLWLQNVKDVNENNNLQTMPAVIDIKSYWQQTLQMIDAIKNDKPMPENGHLKTLDENK